MRLEKCTINIIRWNEIISIPISDYSSVKIQRIAQFLGLTICINDIPRQSHNSHRLIILDFHNSPFTANGMWGWLPHIVCKTTINIIFLQSLFYSPCDPNNLVISIYISRSFERLIPIFNIFSNKPYNVI